MFQSVSGHSSEQSTAHNMSRPTVSQLKGVSDTISNWFENHRPQRTQMSTVINTNFRSKLESNDLQVDRSRKFSERTLSSPAIFKATSKLFSSLGCCNDKNWFNFFSFSLSFAISFHSTRSDARVKFHSGVISLDQSQFFANAEQLMGYVRPHFRTSYVKWSSDPRPATRDPRPVTRDLRPVTCDLWPATRDLRIRPVIKFLVKYFLGD